MKAVHLQTEYLTNPIGMDIRRPRFFWNCEGGSRQTAYQILVCREKDDGTFEQIWDSGKVPSSSMTHIRYGGKGLKSRDAVTWSVTLWDENDRQGETSEGYFEMGLLEKEDWKALWIAGDYRPRKNTRYPADCFRFTFSTDRKVRRARIYATAQGLYELTLNGRKVGDAVLTPGNTDLRKRIQYQTYDITEMISSDSEPDADGTSVTSSSVSNILEAELGDGWYRGSSSAFGVQRVYGSQTKLLCQIEILYEDGTRMIKGTDGSWNWSDDGPIRFDDLKDGENVDFNCHPSYEKKAIVCPTGKTPVPSASDNVCVTMHERFTPTLITTPSGKTVFDFGQNLAGFLSFHMQAKKGQTMKIRLGEILDKNGEFMQYNMQERRPVKDYNRLTEILFVTGMGSKFYKGETQPTPLQEYHFTFSGGEDVYRTKFSISGFRYALVETDIPVRSEDFASIAVYSDMEQTGDYQCSDPEVNQLVRNVRWSMKSNYADVPTDCPTRERLAWTGDAQIFFDTGSYFMNTASFMRKWMRDLRDGQKKDGKLPAVVPDNGAEICYDATGSSSGWHDAAILIPYRYWKKYGDFDQLKISYPSMKKAAMFMIRNTGMKDRKAAKENPYNTYTYEKGMHLGEWLEPKEFQEEISAKSRPSHPEECTAYLSYSMRHMEEAAKVLGYAEDAKLYHEYAEEAKKAYNWLFLRNGAPDTDRQAKLVRPLAFHLYEDEGMRRALADRLAEAVRNRDYKIGTGFLSTPFVLQVLVENGYADLAYRMLENRKCPGWLYEVEQGATTTWETWEGYTGYQGTGSYNHYSPGAVCGWLFGSSAGIRVSGENQFVIRPVPDPTGVITWAEGEYRSVYGTVRSRWEKTDAGFRFDIVIPPNTEAEVILPNGHREKLESGMKFQESVLIINKVRT